MPIRLAVLTGVILLATGCSKSESAATAPAGAEADASATPAQTVVANPSFDCAKAEGEAQKLVCSDVDLAAMDRELGRLYDLALTGPHAADRKAELQATQRGWIKGRDDCWKEDDKRNCVFSSYAMRIAELRQGYADSRSKDDAGVSLGPVALACEGVDFGIAATFINTDPGGAFLSWKDQSIALGHVPSGSGAKYEGKNYAGTGSLFTRGDEALVTLPGDTERNCKVEEIG